MLNGHFGLNLENRTGHENPVRGVNVFVFLWFTPSKSWAYVRDRTIERAFNVLDLYRTTQDVGETHKYVKKFSTLLRQNVRKRV